jgi:2-dehydropantoate 2-reductase
MKNVCIVGAGAIGGLIGTRLAAAGTAQVSAVARGATLEALRSQGWRVQGSDGLLQATAVASSDPRELGVQDLVVLAVKCTALTQVAQTLAPLIGSDTLVMPAMNGVPWWFCHGVEGFPQGHLQHVDPHGAVAAAIPYTQVLGCVVHASAHTSEPGLVQHKMGRGLIVGEPCGGDSARVQQVVDLLKAAGFDATQSSQIRYDIWYKLWGNMTMNPVSAITGATADRLLADPLVRDFCSAAMAEAQQIGARIGCPIAQSPPDRHAITAKLGAFKTSMLQDAQAGRAIELDAIVGAVREIGQRLDIATPQIDTLLGLTRLFARVHGLYPD